MAKPRHLSRAPITEALIDIRVIPNPGVKPEQLKVMRERLLTKYPLAEERWAAQAQPALIEGQAPTATSRELGLHGVWVRTADEKEIGQFRVDGFTFNRLKPYTSWDAMLPKALELWALYVELVQPVAVTRTAVRYINHLPLRASGSELEDFIVTGPRLPEGVPLKMNGFSNRVLLKHPEKGLMANVSQALEVGVQSEVQTLLLDIDAFKVGDLGTERSTLEPLLGDLRDYKNGIFFGSLTEAYVGSFA